MKVSKNQVRQLRRENKTYPKTLIELPFDTWPVAMRLAPPERVPRRVFRSRDFLVQVFTADGDHVRLSACRTDFDVNAGRWRENITWNELQRLKAEAGFADAWAVEVFPPESEIVDVANMRHLFMLPEAPSFAWKKEPKNG